MESTSKRASARDLTWVILIVFPLLLAFFVHSRPYSTNENSRLAAIDSLINRGTWAIDNSEFSFTLDKIRVGDQFYSSKPPTLAFLGTGLYGLLQWGWDVDLNSSACEPGSEPSRCLAISDLDNVSTAYVVLVLILVSLPATVILALIYRHARNQGMPNWASISFIVILGLGTALFPYSTVFTNHILSAAGIVVAIYILLTYPEPSKGQLALAGFATTLSATVDLSAGIFLLGVFIYVLVQYRKRAIYFFIGGLIPGLLAIVLNFQITGTPLPPQLYTQGYDYPGSAFLTNPGGHRTSTDLLGYSFHLLIGDRGLFSFFPITLWYMYGLIKSLQAPGQTTRRLAWVVAISSLVYFLYFALRTNSYGGFTFASRWLINPIPVIALFAVDPSLYQPHPKLKGGLVAILGILSIVSTYPGVLNPWTPAYPLLRLTFSIPEDRQFIPLVLSGYNAYEEINPEIRESFGINTVLRRWIDSRSGLVIPEDEAWLFIDESTFINPLIAGPLGLDLSGGYTLKADLSSQAQEWLGTFDTETFQSDMLIPAAESERHLLTLPHIFDKDDDSMSLMGYQIDEYEKELTLITGWRIEERTYPTGSRRIFVHLLDQEGNIVEQSDMFSARYQTLFPGDLFFQVQTLPLDQLLPGHYWVQIGVYDPDTGSRLPVGESDRLLLKQIEIAE